MPALIVDTARCAADTVDGETLIIDTVSGHLRVLTGIAPVVWDRLLEPRDAEALVAEVADRYDEAAGEAVRGLLDELREAALLITADGATGAHPIAAAGLDWPEQYETPGVERYDDIADIMLMDPVHEVDVDQGWPRRPAEPG